MLFVFEPNKSCAPSALSPACAEAERLITAAHTKSKSFFISNNCYVKKISLFRVRTSYKKNGYKNLSAYYF